MPISTESLLLYASIVILIGGLLAWISHINKKNNKLRNSLNNCSEQLEQLQQAFHRFAPQKVVENIIQRGTSVEADRKEVTVLFTDIVGFTSIAEQMEPEQLVDMLNRFLRRMSTVIRENQGHVSKFIGDEIMALYGVPKSNPWHCRDAVNTALAMRDELHRYNDVQRKNGLPSLQIGIGIHSGTSVAGVIGSFELMEYTVIGDTVNTASRIQGLTRDYDTDILISHETATHIKGNFNLEPIGQVKVKGREHPIRAYKINGAASAYT